MQTWKFTALGVTEDGKIFTAVPFTAEGLRGARDNYGVNASVRVDWGDDCETTLTKDSAPEDFTHIYSDSPETVKQNMLCGEGEKHMKHLTVSWRDEEKVFLEGGCDKFAETLLHLDSPLPKIEGVHIRQDQCGPDCAYSAGFRRLSADLLFANCDMLQALPEDLFTNNKELCNFNGTFYGCDALVSVPANLFSENIHAESFNDTFRSCGSIGALPENLFSHNKDAIFFMNTFQNCDCLWHIPEKLFSTCEKAEIFFGTFDGCFKLEYIPENLFKNCKEARAFNETFYNCESLCELPKNLFRNNKKAKHFVETFRNCVNLGTVPTGMFTANKNASFWNTFYGCENLKLPSGRIFSSSERSRRERAFEGATLKRTDVYERG